MHMHRRTDSQPCAFSIAISAPSLVMAWVVGPPSLPDGMGRSQPSNLPAAIGIEHAIPGEGGAVPSADPLGCLGSLHGPPEPKRDTKQCMSPLWSGFHGRAGKPCLFWACLVLEVRNKFQLVKTIHTWP